MPSNRYISLYIIYLMVYQIVHVICAHIICLNNVPEAMQQMVTVFFD